MITYVDLELYRIAQARIVCPQCRLLLGQPRVSAQAQLVIAAGDRSRE